jgi:hypothetical protein
LSRVLVPFKISGTLSGILVPCQEFWYLVRSSGTLSRVLVPCQEFWYLVTGSGTLCYLGMSNALPKVFMYVRSASRITICPRQCIKCWAVVPPSHASCMMYQVSSHTTYKHRRVDVPSHPTLFGGESWLLRVRIIASIASLSQVYLMVHACEAWSALGTCELHCLYLSWPRKVLVV